MLARSIGSSTARLRLTNSKDFAGVDRARQVVRDFSSWQQRQQVRFHSFARITPGLVSSSDLVENSCCRRSTENPLFQQVRWKRKDGHKAFGRERPPTKAQRKRYNRSLQAKESKHGVPGSKAGIRREWEAERREDIMNPPPDLQLDDMEYGMGDAMLDDLMGNTAYLTAQETPEPAYLGHLHKKFFSQAANRMQTYKDQLERLSDPNSDTSQLVAADRVEMPNDKNISLALRAFRDRYGTKRQPIGMVKALEHLVKDIGVPITAFGENTYTTLMTCSRSPAEARRIIDLMRKEQHPVSSYSWSILVDTYAKAGDFKGCANAQLEMINDGIPPTLVSFTSLLAACAKVCNDGRVAHSIRAQAGKLGWEKWQEMRVVGVHPDVMAYGAMLKLTAARGHPERAINILEEMQQMDVKPTTLCFSYALRAVAKSHSTSIRYERGASRKMKRREFLTHHHGKLARSIVLLAENAEVKQDQGFVSALIMCAAAAGDVATAKAIYIASQIRQLDELRTIGSDQHLARLRGDDIHQYEGGLLEDPSLSNTNSSLSLPPQNMGRKYPSFEEREYGKDSRVLSAILHACACAVDKNGIGDMWQGRENQGYLCENSLRLLKARQVPKFVDNSIPGQTRTDALKWEGEYRDEDYRGKKRSPRKFRGVEEDIEAGTTLDQVDGDIARMYEDKEGRLKKEYRSTSFEDVWKLKYGEDWANDSGTKRIEERPMFNLESGLTSTGTGDASVRDDGTNEIEEQMFFDRESMRWTTIPLSERTKTRPSSVEINLPAVEGPPPEHEEMYFHKETSRWMTRAVTPSNMTPETEKNMSQAVSPSESRDAQEAVDFDDSNEDLYFDKDERRWKTRSRADAENARRTAFENQILQAKSQPNTKMADREKVDTEKTVKKGHEFQIFYSELRKEMQESGETIDDLTEDEAYELFLSAEEEYNEMMDMDPDEFSTLIDELDDEELATLSSKSLPEPESALSSNLGAAEIKSKQELHAKIEELKDEWDDSDDAPDDMFEPSFSPSSYKSVHSQSSPVREKTFLEEPTVTTTHAAQEPTISSVRVLDAEYVEKPLTGQSPSPKNVGLEQIAGGRDVFPGAFQEHAAATDAESFTKIDEQLELLRGMLPGFSDKRLSKIRKAFRSSLGDPSLLELTLIAREQMPDYITNNWLKHMSSLTSRYIMHKAVEEEKIDVHVLNAVLELDTAAGSLDRALQFYETEFAIRNLEPTAYSARLVVQMFVKNKRLQRALTFKNSIEMRGRTLDILSYGALIDYCSRHEQLGSALLLLKECLSKHEAPPGEAYLKHVRLLCRQADLIEEIGLEDMIGKDPIEWLRHGEANLKRDMSKKGRRDINLGRNRLMQL